MGFDWLKGPREAAGFTQEALAAGVGETVKAIQRLERCDPETPKRLPYARLAEALGICPIQLAEDHVRDLAAANLPEHAQRARDEADRLRRERSFPCIEPAPIQSALAACSATGLAERIAARPPRLPDEAAQAGHIARLLNDGRLGDYATLVDIPLEETIARAATADHLEALEQFLRAILRACAARYEGLDPGRWHQHHGESKAWPYRAMIDQSQQLDGMRLVRAAPDTTEARLDDGPDSTRAVRSGNVSQLSPEARVHQLVCTIADTLGTVDQDRPAAGDSQGFARFCTTVNNELFRHNSRHSHVFGLWDQTTCEAEEVKQALLRLLPNLRLFDTGEPKRASTVLRADSATLETWYASHLRALDGRRKALPATSAPAPSIPSTTKAEPTSMSESQNAPIQFNVNIHSGNGPANQAAGQAQAHQHNLDTPQAELLPLLDRLLAETTPGDSRYAELRKACRNAQGELEETKALSESSKTLLERAIEALPTADKVVGIATKVADLISRVPGLGS